ncbi:hypothetical protein [Streptomyces djakartensis]
MPAQTRQHAAVEQGLPPGPPGVLHLFGGGRDAAAQSRAQRRGSRDQ